MVPLEAAVVFCCFFRSDPEETTPVERRVAAAVRSVGAAGAGDQTPARHIQDGRRRAGPESDTTPSEAVSDAIDQPDRSPSFTGRASPVPPPPAHRALETRVARHTSRAVAGLPPGDDVAVDVVTG